MELTPIRIPGKRLRKGEPPPTLALRKKKKKKGNKIEKRKNKVPGLKVSYLEKQLPLEIIERIFWMSENVNFLRSGLRIGQLLSGEPTRRETFLQAFGPTWDVWFGCTKGRGGITSYHGWQEDVSRLGGNPKFQSALLQYSWVDIAFILERINTWVQRYASDRFFQHQKLWGDPDTVHKLDDDPGGFNNFKSAKQYFQHDYDAFCSTIDNPLPPLGDMTSWIEVHRETHIPDRLLTGPWDEEDTQKLFWLYRAGAQLSDEQTWEVTLEGYHHAMATETYPPTGNINLPVIRLLFILGGDHWPEHVIFSEFDKLERFKVSLPLKGRSAICLKYATIASMMICNYPRLGIQREQSL